MALMHLLVEVVRRLWLSLDWLYRDEPRRLAPELMRATLSSKKPTSASFPGAARACQARVLACLMRVMNGASGARAQARPSWRVEVGSINHGNSSSAS